MAERLTSATRILPWMLLLAGCASVHPPSTSFPRASTPFVSPPGLPEIRTIVVDAGHGGHDPGTGHHGLREKDLTLDIARRLEAELTARGLSVKMTRNRDEFIALSRRPAMANRLSADLFVSVHVNANRNRRVSGVTVYYPRESVVSDSAAFPPEVEADDVALPTTTVRQVLWDLVLTRSRHSSTRLARQVCRALQDRLHVSCRGTHGARFVVLREAWMPAVLVEVGFVTNRAEAARLSSPSYRQTIAQGIADGVIAYAQTLGTVPS